MHKNENVRKTYGNMRHNFFKFIVCSYAPAIHCLSFIHLGGTAPFRSYMQGEEKKEGGSSSLFVLVFTRFCSDFRSVFSHYLVVALLLALHLIQTLNPYLGKIYLVVPRVALMRATKSVLFQKIQIPYKSVSFRSFRTLSTLHVR